MSDTGQRIKEKFSILNGEILRVYEIRNMRLNIQVCSPTTPEQHYL